MELNSTLNWTLVRIKAVILSTKTNPAEASFTILALSLCFSVTRSTKFSIVVFNISALITKPTARVTIIHSVKSNLNKNPRIVTERAAIT